MKKKIGIFHWPSALICLALGFAWALHEGLADYANGYIAFGGMLSRTLGAAAIAYIVVRPLLPLMVDKVGDIMDKRRIAKRAKSRKIADHFD